MGFRFNKRIKIAKGVSLNVSKKGISTSAKIGNVTLNSRGRVTASIPGTGISYSRSLKTKKQPAHRQAQAQITKGENSYQNALVIMVISVIFIILGFGAMFLSPVAGVIFLLIGFIMNRSSSNVAKIYKNKVNDEKEKLNQLELQFKAEADEFERLYQLNQKGMAFEKDGHFEQAILCYEQVIQEGFDGSHPFERLMVLYRKQKQYDDEIRIINQAITQFNQDKTKSKVIKYEERLQKALLLQEKTN